MIWRHTQESVTAASSSSLFLRYDGIYYILRVIHIVPYIALRYEKRRLKMYDMKLIHEKEKNLFLMHPPFNISHNMYIYTH